MLIFARFAEANSFAFGTGLESWVAAELPETQLLDLDSNSGRAYALQLAEAAAQAPAFVLWLKSDELNLPLGAMAGLLETWLRHPGPKLLVLEGEHAQTERMGMAQNKRFCKGKTAAELKPQVLKFFANITLPA